ncbi:acyl carrier protein [Rhizobium sp. TRM95111]|uniref:acyl carrier protein n=1 Tax=Rhizobium alarense TaxID=2846851 RepID=UPI001F48837E|nr:acyl carrier protein [Rhizobium alarense]MCF3642175.1 acyl carrier protein [Rhizobium alarense]
MSLTTTERLRETVGSLLAARGDTSPVTDEESLFVTGRLDSLAATEMIMLLEQDFGLDLAGADFDVSALDTISDLARLVGTRTLQ